MLDVRECYLLVFREEQSVAVKTPPAPGRNKVTLESGLPHLLSGMFNSPAYLP